MQGSAAMPDETMTEQGLGVDGDVFYQMLMNAHEGLSKEESDALNMRLVLLMANHIGSLDALSEIIDGASDMPQNKV